MSQKFWYRAKVIRVIDGDTIDLMVDLGFNIHHKIKVKLYGVNAPKSDTKDLEEKALGIKAKEFTKDWFTNHDWVYVNTVLDKNDKYGYILAKIYTDEEIARPEVACLNEDIIESGNARECYGVRNKTWIKKERNQLWITPMKKSQ